MVTRHIRDTGVGDPTPRPGWSAIDIGDRLPGGRFEVDLVSEGFEFADESAFPSVGVVDTSCEVVGTEVAVGAGLSVRSRSSPATPYA